VIVAAILHHHEDVGRDADRLAGIAAVVTATTVAATTVAATAAITALVVVRATRRHEPRQPCHTCEPTDGLERFASLHAR